MQYKAIGIIDLIFKKGIICPNLIKKEEHYNSLLSLKII